MNNKNKIRVIIQQYNNNYNSILHEISSLFSIFIIIKLI